MEPKLAKALMDKGLLKPIQFEKAKEKQKETGAKLEDVLDSLGYVPKAVLIQTISEVYGIPKVNLSLDIIDPQVVKLVSPQMAEKFKLIPISREDGVLNVAMADPLDLMGIDNVKVATGVKDVNRLIANENDILEVLEFFFPALRKSLKIHNGSSGRDTPIELMQQQEGETDTVAEDELDDAPTIRSFNTILSRAIEQAASDIHIEPAENIGRVRYRLDGVLHEVEVLPRHLALCLVSRVKVLASLDIAERRVPQDGRFFVRYMDKDVDLRVATMPTTYGETCVLRLLDQSKSTVRLESLGFGEDQTAVVARAVAKPAGMILVTGPTGSGKTTTLCAVLNYVNSMEKKIITLEDPVEYRMKIVNQVSINPVAGLTYASGLRAILRNDPDVVLVGEIRDRESAMIAVQATLTGHLLLSTLHTTGTAESIMRLVDLGVEPFYVREVVELIVAQRLVRVLCNKCRQARDPSDAEKVLLFGDNGHSPAKVYNAVGCPECLRTGYRGRTAVFELLAMSKTLREMLVPGVRAADLREQARKEGMKTFWEAAVDKILLGGTTVEEARRLIPGAE